MIDLSEGLRLAMSQALAQGFAGGTIRLFSGTPPATASDAETGTLLGVVSVDASGNGLTFLASASYVYNPPAARWAFTGLASGNAAWFRVVAPGDSGQVSATEPRIDGTIGEFGGDADMQWTTTVVTAGITYTIDSFIYIVHPIARTAP
jgi:hypothetical protein